MSADKTMGGSPYVPKFCRDCREWIIGGKCKKWVGQYKYALHNACSSFMAKDDDRTKSNNA